MENILKGLRVLDLTRVLAGPFTTRILADFGAEVIKVQSKRAVGRATNTSPYFCAWNRNKRSVLLNMDHPEARPLFLRLVEISDLVIENFSPRVMSNWGLGYERLKRVNPALIMASMSGMGQTGPWKDFVSFGPTLQSLGGLTHLTSPAGQEPTGVGFAYADILSGLYGAAAVLAALRHRDRTGEGQYIDLSQYEALCTSVGPVLLSLLADEGAPDPRGDPFGHLPAAPYGCYRCSGQDRWCAIAVFTDAQWRALCEVMGHPGWTREERFARLEGRRSHRADLDERVERWTLRHTAEEIVEGLQASGVASGIVQDAGDLARDPHLAARSFFRETTHPVLGTRRTDTHPIRFDGAAAGPWKPSPLPGEDNEYVYGGLLGLSSREIEACVAKGVIY